MANIFEINRVSNKITLGTTDTIINIASHTASRILALDASKNLEVVTIGASLDYTRPTLNTIQDIRTSASPTHAGLNIVANAGQIVFNWTSTVSFAELKFAENSNAMGFIGVFGSAFGEPQRGNLILTSALNNDGGILFRTKTSGTYQDRVKITNNGNVGINTIDPSAKLDVAGDMLFSGAGSGLPFGEISVVGNSTETTIVSQNVYVQITIFDTNGENLNATPDHTNDHITIVKAGRYFISCSITLNSIGGSGSTAEIEVKKNNGAARVGSLHVDRTLSGGGTESGAITITGIANLAVDDTIEVWVKNETNTQNYVVEDITLSLIQIGGA